MKIVTDREVHQGFMDLLTEAEGGSTVTMTRDGRSVAVLSPDR
jgi:antitoxin (DNA-binding transcriptional repressor) of toxin-antitoxin stability system